MMAKRLSLGEMGTLNIRFPPGAPESPVFENRAYSKAFHGNM